MVERHLLDERVHAVDVPLEGAAIGARELGEECLSLRAVEAVAARHLVHQEVARTEQLGEPAGRRSSEDVHLEESILGLRVAVRVGASLGGAATVREDVRDSPAVPEDGDRVRRRGEAGGRGEETDDRREQLSAEKLLARRRARFGVG